MNEDEENRSIHERSSPTYERRIAHLDNLMVVVCDFTDGPMKSPENPHSHPHEQITYVAEGELYFFKEEKNNHLFKGDLIIVPPGVPHCIQTISGHVRLVDSFSPVREDFLKNS
jgi:mannose-6-phosphate isomerase-like protein (cupin superfamily)